MELHRLRIKGCPIEVDEVLLPAQTLIDHELATFGDISEEKCDAAHRGGRVCAFFTGYCPMLVNPMDFRG